MSSSRKELLRQWAASGRLPPERIQEAVATAGLLPSASQWPRFLSRLLLVSGSVLLTGGILFIGAFNWDAIPPKARFAILEVLILGALALWHRLPEGRASGTALTAAAVLLGGLLASVGQAYQTGADKWQLFAVWAALVTPWAVFGRSAGLWLFWSVLVNISLILFAGEQFPLFGWFLSGAGLQMVLLGFNTAMLIAWDTLTLRSCSTSARHGPRLLAIFSALPANWLAIEAIVGRENFGVGLALWPFWLLLMMGIYRRRVPDLFMLALAALSVIVVLTVGLARQVLNHGDSLPGYVLILGWVVGSSTAAVRWLRAVNREGGHHD